MDIHIIFAKISWYLLVVILLFRPLGEVLGSKQILNKLKFRKHLGIACGFAAILHIGIYFISNELLFAYFTNPAFWSFHNLFGWGNVAFAALLIPFLTSNKASQKFFKKHWKTLQKFSYPALVLTGVHVALSRGELISTLIPISIWVILWTWANYKKRSLVA